MIAELIFQLWAEYASPNQADRKKWWQEKSWFGKIVVGMFWMLVIVILGALLVFIFVAATEQLWKVK